jgi:hypothetical protein
MIAHYSRSYALYSSLSPGFQKYLEGLSAVHSAAAQAQGARAAGLHVRRQEIDSVHPGVLPIPIFILRSNAYCSSVVRVHPVTGWKSVYVNPGQHPVCAGKILLKPDRVCRVHASHRGHPQSRVGQYPAVPLRADQREP